MRINYLGLQAFLSIAERGSFRRAGTHLNLSQTAVSHRMRRLEDELGVKLFDRTTRELSLTKAGLDLMEKAKRIVFELERTFEEVRQHGPKRQDRLSIACLPAFTIFRLPSVLSEFHQEFPDVSVRIFDVPSNEIADLLQRDEVEFGLSVVSVNRWDFDVEPVGAPDPMVLACHKSHELASKRRVKWSDLSDFPLIRVGASTALRPLIDDALGALKDELNWRYEVQAVETAVGLVEAGRGVTVVPMSNVELSASKMVLGKAISGPSINCAFGLVTKRGVALSPVAARFRSLLRDHFKRQKRTL
jgi:DNA-binding transcriptional LysR family regulator